MGVISFDNLPLDHDLLTGSGATTPTYVQASLSAEELASRQYFMPEMTGSLRNISFFTSSHSGSHIRIIVKPDTPEIAENYTVIQCLDEIKKTFPVTVDELAKILQVTRRTIYNWRENKALPHKTTMQRLFTLTMVARNIASSGINLTKPVLRDPGTNNTSLLDMLSANTLNAEQIMFSASRLHMVSTAQTAIADPFA